MLLQLYLESCVRAHLQINLINFLVLVIVFAFQSIDDLNLALQILLKIKALFLILLISSLNSQQRFFFLLQFLMEKHQFLT